MKFKNSLSKANSHLILAGIFSLTLSACSGGGSSAPAGGGGGTGSPQIVGSVDLPGTTVGGVAVSGGYAYAGVGTSGLRILDVSDKSTPVIVGEENTITANIGMVFIPGTLVDSLFVTGGIRGAYNIDVTDPSFPFVADSVDTPGNATGIAISTDLSAACTADGATGGGVGSVVVHSAVFLSVGTAVTTPERTNFSAISGDYCFVTAGNELNGSDSPKLYVIKINPTISTVPDVTFDLTGAPSGIAIIGDHAYIAASGDPGMYVINISNPLIPVIVGRTEAFPTTGEIAVDETRMRAYIATPDTVGFPDDGFKIIDISNADAPTLIATAVLPGDTRGIDVLDGFVYATTTPTFGATGSNQFHIVDVSAF